MKATVPIGSGNGRRLTAGTGPPGLTGCGKHAAGRASAGLRPPPGTRNGFGDAEICPKRGTDPPAADQRPRAGGWIMKTDLLPGGDAAPKAGPRLAGEQRRGALDWRPQRNPFGPRAGPGWDIPPRGRPPLGWGVCGHARSRCCAGRSPLDGGLSPQRMFRRSAGGRVPEPRSRGGPVLCRVPGEPYG